MVHSVFFVTSAAGLTDLLNALGNLAFCFPHFSRKFFSVGLKNRVLHRELPFGIQKCGRWSHAASNLGRDRSCPGASVSLADWLL